MKHQRELAGLAAAAVITAAALVASRRRTRACCYRQTPEFQAITRDYLL
jgi:hypothetical protein